MSEYAPPPPDDKDWTWVVERTCPQCGFDASRVTVEQAPGMITALTAPWADVLGRDDVAVRPAPEVWSALEYACHVRDVCLVFGERTTLMLEHEAPTFANWDQDEAAVQGRYLHQDPTAVGTGIGQAATAWAKQLREVQGAKWERPGLRGNGAQFTVLTLTRYGLHDLAHHLVDVGAVESHAS
ncbi:DinB family protein [Microlunatus sp. Y2014]|uniref:DinB family protein n=1 Tax=Microlunatus sp. Y2014 TaxID=3418488 RepID=UPI003DA7552D